MTRPDYIIAIDPDCSRSGVAFLELSTRRLEATSLSFPALLDYVLQEQRKADGQGSTLHIIVEAGWMVSKSNYHGYHGARAEKIAKNVGANHETGRKIVEMLRHYGMDVREQHPLAKIWSGPDGKITAEELEEVTGLHGRTNQDARDAAILAWVVAGLPLKMKTIGRK